MRKTVTILAALALAATACGTDPVAETRDSWGVVRQALDKAVGAAWTARFSYGAALDALDGDDSEWAAARDKAWTDFEEARTLWREAKRAWDRAWDNDYAYWNARDADDAAMAAVEAKVTWDAEEAAFEAALDTTERALDIEDAVRSGSAVAAAASEAEDTARAAWLLVTVEWTAAWAASITAWEKYAASWQIDNGQAAEQVEVAIRRAREALSWDTGWSAAMDAIISAWDAARGG